MSQLLTRTRNVRDHKVEKYQTLEEVIEEIRSCRKLKGVTEQIRSLLKTEPKKAGDLKRSLPTVAYSGRFSYVSTACLEEHSGYLGVDYDGKDDTEAYEKMGTDPYVVSRHWSVRKGIHAVVLTGSLPHEKAFAYYQEYFAQRYSILIDESMRRVGQMLALSHDKDVSYNENARGPMTLAERWAEINSRLEKAKPKGPRVMQGCCPAHNDEEPSLTVTLTDDKILMNCHAGCSFTDICKALGLREADLFEPDEKRHQVHVNELKLQKHLKEIAQKVLTEQKLPDFEPDVLPATLAEFVTSASASTESSSIIPTMSMLSTLSGYAMHRVWCSDYFQELHPNIWSVIIAPSGAFKSTGLTAGSRLLKDIDGYNNQLSQQFAQRNEEGKAALYQSRKRTLPGTFTWQSCLDALQEQGGGVWILSEFNSWLSNVNAKYNEGMKSRLTAAYDVDDVIEERTRGHGSIRIDRPYMSICGVSTIEFLKGHIGQDDLLSGFLPRFLWFVPPSNHGKRPAPLPKRGVVVNQREWGSYQTLHDLCMKMLTEEPREVLIKDMSKEARALYEDYFNRIYDVCEGADPKIQQYLYVFAKRWGPTLLKLAMLMQLVLDRRRPTPTEESLRSAWAVLWYAIQSTTILLNSHFGASPVDTKNEKVRAYIAKKGGSVEYRTLVRSKVLSGDTMEYDRIIENLVNADLLVFKRAKIKKDSVLELKDS
jgi:hypothetical protein